MTWTCYGCGASIETSNAELFAKLVDSHMSNCKE